MDTQTKTGFTRINNVEINGHLGSDPELITTKSGHKKVRVSLAQNTYTSNGKQVSWYYVIGWEDLAESMVNQLRKGDMVTFKGRLQSREYPDPAGKTRYALEIVASSFTTANVHELQQAG
ncbi:MAG: single-stranded DNA-binding protein [Bacteroidetes bacterium]|nr:single-stranded DNA-binding protein [Bacteroidota bacterium]